MSKHENSNQFKEGLLMDLHPLQTPNTVLTDNLNGTFITYNGNEYSLQNDMGNFKLKNCKLKPGYLPVGTASYADTIYILSYNPIENNVELGSYPSPVEYSENGSNKTKQILGIVENYIFSNPGVETKDKIEIKESDAKNYIKTIIFDGDSSVLKRGDKYTLEQTEKNLCGFEELIYEVLLENGTTDKIENVHTVEEQPVTWDSPGNIQIRNHLFEIGEYDCRITQRSLSETGCELTVLYEMLITDPYFIKKIDEYGDDIFKTNGDHISFNAVANFEKESIEGIKQKVYIESWLGDYRKISYLVKFEISGTKETGSEEICFPEKVSIEIEPVLNTSLKVGDNENSKIYSIVIPQDSKKEVMEVSLGSIKVDKIGDSVFYWKETDNGEMYLYINCTKLDDYKYYYKVDTNTDTNNDTGWTLFNVSDSISTIDITTYKNTICAISFGYSPITDLSEIKDSDMVDVNTKIVFFWNGDMDSIWNNYANWDEKSDFFNKRYDLIPFSEIYKKHLNVSFEIGDVDAGDLGDIYDEDAKEEEFYKYFSRFNDSTIEFPSVVEKAPQSNKSNVYVEIPMKVNFEFPPINDPENIGDYEIRKDSMKFYYTDRKDLPGREELVNENTTFQIWNKVNCQVSQDGDSFYFADRVNCKKLMVSDNPIYFDAVNVDKLDEVCINDRCHNWSPIDGIRYAAIRIGWVHDNFLDGCRQMDFWKYKKIDPNSTEGWVDIGEDLNYDWSWEQVSGMCQYIGQFHTKIRNEFENLKNSNEFENLKTIVVPRVDLVATTFFRGKGHRASFTNKSGLVSICPDWDKWKDRNASNGSISDDYDGERYWSKSQSFMALPLYSKVSDKKWGDAPIYTKVLSNIDRQVQVGQAYYHWLCEILKTDVEIEGIGLVKWNGNQEPGWNLAWIDNWENLSELDQKFKKCSQTTLTAGTDWIYTKDDAPEWSGKLTLKATIPDDIQSCFKDMIKIYPAASSVWNESETSVDLCSNDIWTSFDTKALDDKFSEINQRIGEDGENIEKHPIFKCFKKAGSAVSDRIRNWPVAGVYPDIPTASDTDVFASPNITVPWRNVYVDGKGNPYLVNCDPKNNIWVCKNLKKFVFGYFPYVE